MDSLGIFALPAALFIIILVVLAILTPYFIYRMAHYLREINRKMDDLIDIVEESHGR